MAMHELATNAVKYGALSNDSGKVHLDWTVAPGGRSQAGAQWRESGGPPVARPAARVLAPTLIERALQQEQGSARMLFLPEGLDGTLDIKL